MELPTAGIKKSWVVPFSFLPLEILKKKEQPKKTKNNKFGVLFICHLES